MSALAGYWSFVDNPDSRVCCARMLASQKIYGPHDSTLWAEGAIAFGRQLFRALPEDKFDQGPLVSEDRRLLLVADVRLDNREELASALLMPRDLERRSCDAKLLLASLERWGELALDRIVGDFAFALWIRDRRQLLLARDFLGQRPLHYHRGKDFLAFATMPKGLHALPEISYEPDEATVAEFVALMPEGGSGSFFRHIRRVEAGHIVTVTCDGLSSRRYWHPQRPRPGSTKEYVEGLRYHLDQAVASRLRRTSGHIASHLSAGLDSASVTATAARLLAPDRMSALTAVPRSGYDGPIPTGRLANEGPLASATAAMYPNIDHILVHTGGTSPLKDMERIFHLFDRPILNLCNWTWLRAINDVAQERGVSVLLTGVMGNITTSYDGIDYLSELFAAGRWQNLSSAANALVANSEMRWRGIFAQVLGPYVPVGLWRLVNSRYRDAPGNILDYAAICPSYIQKVDLARRAEARGLDVSCRPRRDGFQARLWALHRVDLGNYYKGQLAGWGLDLRDPTTDRRLVEYCLSVPAQEFIVSGKRRSLAKRAFSDRLPSAVLTEKRRGLQAADWHEALTAARDEVREELQRLSSCGAVSAMLDTERLKQLERGWPQSGWEKAPITQAYRLALLRGLSAGHFLRKAMGTN